MEEEISLMELFDIVRDHLWSFVLSTVIGALVAFLAVQFLVTPLYSSSTQLLVNQGTTDEQPIQYNQIQSNVQLINTYRDIVLADSTLTEVNSQLGNSYTISELRDAISVDQQPNSQAFTISAKMPSPEAAQVVTSTVEQVFESQVKEAYRTNDPDIFVLTPATFNPNPVSPNKKLYLLVGGLLGLMLSAGYHLVRELLDTTVNKTTDVDQLGLICLGEISRIDSKTRNETRLFVNTDHKRNRRKV